MSRILASVTISAALALCLTQAPQPVSAAEQFISGELVVLDGSADRFRLVGHDGTFKAPAGVPLGELDGKNVEVQLSGGRVTGITERSVAITPITSGYETVRGQMVVRDPVARSFNFAGDTRVYIAEPTIEIAPYAGKWVEVTLDSRGQVSALKLVSEPPPPPVSLQQGVVPAPAANAATCAIGNATVASGSTVCRGGITNRCDNGAWVSLGTICR
ncbi:MAG: hypothetical protein SF182_02750 [Deltaproteobacteria bacterium]|nr:hypothetical protein [Deltaproteobacteria bacterium]